LGLQLTECGNRLKSVIKKYFMKKTLASLLGLLMVSSVLFATGNVDEPSAATNMAIVKNGSVMKVFYKPAESGVARISIINSDGAEVFSEYIKTKKGFIRPYNVASLSAGEYIFKVSDEHGSRTEKFSTGGQKKLFYKVTPVKEDPSRYVLSIPANGYENVVVSIYDEENTLLYRGSEQLSGDFARVYHLRDAKGKVSFEVSPN
jgi:hypothetical protein